MNELIYFFGSSLTSIIAFICVLSVIVFIHEFGHYIVARWCNIHSEVFSLGFGPVLWSRVSKHGTRWQIAAIPLGGYVRFKGDRNPSSLQIEPETDAHGGFVNAPLWARTLTVIAGPLANFILSTVIFAALIMSLGIARDELIVGKLHTLPGGTGQIQQGDQILSVEGFKISEYGALAAQDDFNQRRSFTYQILRDGKRLERQAPPLIPARIDGLQPRSAAVNAGLKEGDVILSLNGQTLTHFSSIGDILRANEGRPLKAVIWRQGEKITKTLEPLRRDLPKPEGGFESRWMIGISGSTFFEQEVRRAGIFEALRLGTWQTWTIISQSLMGIGSLIAGDIDRCNLQGPVGIAKTSGDFITIGVAEFIGFIGIVSAAIGLMNLFPIPVLDGGHLILYAYEAITRKKPSPRIVQGLFIVGLGILLALMVFALTNDILCP